MMLSLIVAHAKNFVIGKSGDMPWHLPADLAHFKTITVGHPVIMGRKTFESIGRALPNRLNIVISSNEQLHLPQNVILCSNLEQALSKVSKSDEVFVIGGGSVYREAIKFADRLYLTLINAEIEGDTTFPNYDIHDYIELSREVHEIDEKNNFELTFLTLQRK